MMLESEREHFRQQRALEMQLAKYMQAILKGYTEEQQMGAVITLIIEMAYVIEIRDTLTMLLEEADDGDDRGPSEVRN